MSKPLTKALHTRRVVSQLARHLLARGLHRPDCHPDDVLIPGTLLALADELLDDVLAVLDNARPDRGELWDAVRGDCAHELVQHFVVQHFERQREARRQASAYIPVPVSGMRE